MAPAPRGRGSGRGLVAHVRLDASLRTSLVHLPMALHAPLIERNVPPQTIVVELTALRPDSPPATYYAGWSGHAAPPLSLPDRDTGGGSGTAALDTTIAMSPVLASAFVPPLVRTGSETPCEVRITLLRSPPLPTAARVNVTPLGPDDWEMLSTFAEDVELNLLAQCRAACEGQTLIVFVGRGNRSVCRFTVDSTEPPTQSVLEPPVPAPAPASASKNSSAGASAHSERRVRAVRLSTDTELVIAPKQRAPPGQPQDTAPTALPPTAAGSSSPGAAQAAKARAYLGHTLFRVLPSNIAISSDEAEVPAWTQNAVFLDDATLLALQTAAPTSAPRVAVTRVSCPTGGITQVIFALPSAREEDGLAEPAPAPTRPRRSTAPAVAALAPFKSPAGPTSIALPAQHVLLGSGLRAALQVKDYDLVLLSPGQGDKQLALPGALPASCTLALAAPSEQQVAGVDNVLLRATRAVENHFWARRMFDAGTQGTGVPARSVAAPAGLLITGGAGAGKTSISVEVARRISFLPTQQGLGALVVAAHYVDCAAHGEERAPSVRNKITGWLAAAAWSAPAVLIMDNVDRIAPAEQEHSDGSRARQLAETLLRQIIETARDHDVFVICTAQNTTSLHPVLNAGHLFVDSLHLRAPDKAARQDLLRQLMAKRAGRGAAAVIRPDQLDYVTLAGNAEGYFPADLRDLLDRAVAAAAIRVTGVPDAADDEALTVTMADFAKAQEGFVPQSLREVALQEGGVSWADIGGLHETRRVLRETLEWPVKYGPIFASCPLRLRSGLLLYGYPGCGKTMLASAVAKECGLHFIGVKGPEILNKYIGASEKSVRDLFERAQAAKPCVLFFDEFDAIAPRRGHDSTGVTDRVVNQLLTQMDGAEGLDGVYVLAATSRPDLIDAALLRPGRLDKSLLCPMPSEADRRDILTAVAHKLPLDPAVDLTHWARETPGFSGADLQALLYNAHLNMVHEGIDGIAAPAARAQEGGKENDPSAIQFVRSGSKEHLSGAQTTALQRRLALMLSNTLGAQEKKVGKRDTFGSSTSASASAAGPVRAQHGRVNDSHIRAALGETRPSVPPEEQTRLHKIYNTFAGKRDGAFPDGSAPDSIGARETLM